VLHPESAIAKRPSKALLAKGEARHLRARCDAGVIMSLVPVKRYSCARYRRVS
jgi:hypothetical protein